MALYDFRASEHSHEAIYTVLPKVTSICNGVDLATLKIVSVPWLMDVSE